jgi:poly [ADP-ribose] polymerase 2/3/4
MVSHNRPVKTEPMPISAIVKPTVVRKTSAKKVAAPAAPSLAPVRVTRSRCKRPVSTRRSTPVPSIKRKRTGLKGIVDSSAPLGLVDPAAGIAGSIVISPVDRAPLDCMLVLVDPTKNMDKFFVLQLIKLESGAGHDGNVEDLGSTANTRYIVYTRWGRTGTAGAALEQEFTDEYLAMDCFENKFEDKTGLCFADRALQSPAGKYTNLVVDFVAKAAILNGQGGTFQYWVDDGVDGKVDGWYDYDAEAGQLVDQLHHESQQNPGLLTRIVTSGSWTYIVDLSTMTQTNITHPNHSTRFIRRLAPGFLPDNSPPCATLAAGVAVNTGRVAHVVAVGKLKVTKGGLTHNVTTTGKAGPPHAVHVAPPATVAPSSTVATMKTSTVDAEIAFGKAGRKASEFCVVDPMDVMLNQTNIVANANKFYRIQMLRETAGKGRLYVWTRWGRVGEATRAAMSALLGPFANETLAAIAFGKKYRDKTGNNWDDRESFVAKQGKYQPILVIDDAPEDGTAAITVAPTATDADYLPCALDAKTRELMEVIHSREMMNDALLAFNIDTRKLPLGALDAAQIQKGLDVLDQIKTALSVPGSDLIGLSSAFYTAIPHSFGRQQRPPIISSLESLQACFDRLDAMSDMAKTTAKLEEEENKRKLPAGKVKSPHPADQLYLSLGSSLEIVDKASSEFAVISAYFENTKGSHYNHCQLLDVWKVKRCSENAQFRIHNELETRKLLWHGTSLAVVAAILASGLRIMPHSGGRVGKGIYLASEQSKSACYTSGWNKKYACMFLCEAALGKIAEITRDDTSLRAAPSGFDSVLARGKQTPSSCVDIEIDGKNISVPQGKPVPSFVNQSSFEQDEHLVYRESQVRLRYVISLKL